MIQVAKSSIAVPKVPSKADFLFPRNEQTQSTKLKCSDSVDTEAADKFLVSSNREDY